MLKNRYASTKLKFLLKYFLILTLALALSLLYIMEVILIESAFVVAILTVGFYPLLKVLLNKRIEPLTPKTIIPFTYMLYALGPLAYKEEFSSSTLSIYLSLQLLGMVSLNIGLSMRKRNKLNKNSLNESHQRQILKKTSIIFLLVAFVSTLSEIISFGGIGNLINIGYGGDKFLHSTTTFMIGGGFQWLILSGAIIWYYGLKTSSVSSKQLGIIIISISVIVFFLTGGRSTLVYSFIFISIVYYYQKRNINGKLVIFMLIIGIIASQLYSNARYYLPYGFTETVTNTWRIFTNNPMAFMPLPSNINEFRIPAKSLLEVIENGNGVEFYGRSYISAIGTPFPFINRLFNYIGVNPSVWFLDKYHPDILAGGGGLGFSPVTEGYMNFGMLGVVIHMFLYGWTISWIFQNYKEKRSVSSLLLYAGALPIFVLDGLRIHLGSAFYKLFRIYLMPFFIYLLIHLLSKNRSKNNNVTRIDSSSNMH